MPNTPQQPVNTTADADVERDIPLPSEVMPTVTNASAPEMPQQTGATYQQSQSLAGVNIPHAEVKDDAFIAPQPLNTASSQAPSYSQQFQSPAPQAPSYAPQDVAYGQQPHGNTGGSTFEDRAKKSPSLFERVTGLGGFGKPQAPQQQQYGQPVPPQGYGQPYQPQQPQQSVQQASLNVSSGPVKPGSEDEDLEIPAFLRRQSN
jgi:hypothetical protein